MASQLFACPLCGQTDMVQEVSNIRYSCIADSTLTGGAAGRPVAPGGQTTLAQRLAPPPEPAQPGHIVWYVALVISLLAVIVLCLVTPVLMTLAIIAEIDVGCFNLQAWDYQGCSYTSGDLLNALFRAGVVILILGVAATPFILAIGGLVGYRMNRIDAARKAAWQWALLCRNRLYHCSRDDILFDPVGGQCAPVEQLIGLLHAGKVKAA